MSARSVGPCLILVHPRGDVFERGEGAPHFATEERAVAVAHEYAQLLRDDEHDVAYLAEHLPLTTKRLDDGCLTIACDECGSVFDEHGEGIVHFGSIIEVNASLPDCGWTITSTRTGSKHLCVECSCEQLGHDMGHWHRSPRPEGDAATEWRYCNRCAYREERAA